MRFGQPVSADLVKKKLVKDVDRSVEAKIFGKDNQLKITTKDKVEQPGSEADLEGNKILYNDLKKHFSADMTYEKFVNSYDG